MHSASLFLLITIPFILVDVIQVKSEVAEFAMYFLMEKRHLSMTLSFLADWGTSVLAMLSLLGMTSPILLECGRQPKGDIEQGHQLVMESFPRLHAFHKPDPDVIHQPASDYPTLRTPYIEGSDDPNPPIKQ